MELSLGTIRLNDWPGEPPHWFYNQQIAPPPPLTGKDCPVGLKIDGVGHSRDQTTHTYTKAFFTFWGTFLFPLVQSSKIGPLASQLIASQHSQHVHTPLVMYKAIYKWACVEHTLVCEKGSFKDPSPSVLVPACHFPLCRGLWFSDKRVPSLPFFPLCDQTSGLN